MGYLITGVLPTYVGGRNDMMGTLQRVLLCAENYREDHSTRVVMCYAFVYILLQTFAIPGPIVLSILAGALYPFFHAQVLLF